jgi:hypothetical protein
MITIQVNSDTSKADSNQPLNLVDKCIIDEANDQLDACMVNSEALKLLKDRLATYDRVKSMKKVKKLHFEATPIDDKFLVIFRGNIRHSLFFLIEFRTISKEAYDEAISKLNSASYKLSSKKIDITPSTIKLGNTEEEQKQQSSSVTTSTPPYVNSSQLIFSHAKDESTTSQTSVFCSPTCSI